VEAERRYLLSEGHAKDRHHLQEASQSKGKVRIVLKTNQTKPDYEAANVQIEEELPFVEKRSRIATSLAS
jgi:hypothetical protein